MEIEPPHNAHHHVPLSSSCGPFSFSLCCSSMDPVPLPSLSLSSSSSSSPFRVPAPNCVAEVFRHLKTPPPLSRVQVNTTPDILDQLCALIMAAPPWGTDDHTITDDYWNAGGELLLIDHDHIMGGERSNIIMDLLHEYPEFFCRVRDDTGHSILHWAALKGDLNMCRLILDTARRHETLPPITTLPSRAPLFSNCSSVPSSSSSVSSSTSCSTPSSLLSLLLTCCAVPSRQTALMYAAVEGRLAVVNLLLHAGADLHARDCLGATALLLTVQFAKPLVGLRLLRELLPEDQCSGQDYAEKIHAGTVDKHGCDAVHWAAHQADILWLRLLDYFGASLIREDAQGMTPLHRAAVAQQPDAAQYLLEREPGVAHTLTKNGLTPQDLAKLRQYPNPYLLELLDPVRSTRPALLFEPLPAYPQHDATQHVASLQSNWKSYVTVYVALMCFALLAYVHTVRTLVPAIVSLRGVDLVPALWATCAALYIALLRGDPGYAPRAPRGQTAVERLMRACGGVNERVLQATMGRLCLSCWALKTVRTKHCSFCQRCVMVFDHHCVWIARCVGAANHRLFVAWGVLHLLHQTASCLCACLAAYQHFAWGLLVHYPLLTLLLVLHVSSYVWTGSLFWEQLRSIAHNYTTNETLNSHRYSHFWRSQLVWTRRGLASQNVLRNPFDKGILRNCYAFWFGKRRGRKSLPHFSSSSSPSSLIQLASVRGGRVRKKLKEEKQEKGRTEQVAVVEKGLFGDNSATERSVAGGSTATGGVPGSPCAT